MKTKLITPTCGFACEMVIDYDESLDYKNVTKIHDESIELFDGSKFKFVSISDFKNANGQSIGEFLLEKHYNFVTVLKEKRLRRL